MLEICDGEDLIYNIIYTYIYIYIYIYIYLKREFDKGMRELKKHQKKKLFKVKSQVEVLAFGAYVFESYQSFNNSQVKLTPCFLCQNYS